MHSRSPAEVSLYLGLATAIATFAGASVALGLLHCSRGRERMVSIGVVFFATVGIAAALITVARARTSGFGNSLIGAGVLAGAVFVLTRAMRLIFTTQQASEKGSAGRSAKGLSTQPMRVFWSTTAKWDPSAGSHGPGAQPAGAVLHRPLRATSAGFLVLVVLATAGAAPDVRDLLKDFFRSRPVGTQMQPYLADCAGARLSRSVPASSSRAARGLLRHYELTSAGDYEKAFALLGPRYRHSNPRWSSVVARGDPRINVTSIGPVMRHGSTALVPVHFYARDCRRTASTDLRCRRFIGRAKMVLVRGRWLFEPSRSAYAVAIVAGDNRLCP